MADTPILPHPFDWPLYWFAVLERAVEHGDHQTAAEAQRELRRLGVRVVYCGRIVSREEATPCRD